MGGRRRTASERPSACLRYDGAGKAQVVRTCARPFGDSFSPKGRRVSWALSAPVPIGQRPLADKPTLTL